MNVKQKLSLYLVHMNAIELLGNKSCYYNSILSVNKWVSYQSWQKVIFMHWQFDPEIIRPLFPSHRGLELDTFNGRAWMSLVGFNVDNAHVRYLPAVPGLSSITELNLRTYVKFNGQPGIILLHIDTNNRWAARLYRLLGLPYHHADVQNELPHEFKYSKANAGAANIRWQAGNKIATKSALEVWLTERYCSYQQVGKNLYCYPVCHFPWQLQEVILQTNEISYNSPGGISLAGNTMALAHYSEGVEALFYMRKKITS